MCERCSSFSLISAQSGWLWLAVRVPGVGLEVPSCEATSPGMNHNSVPLSFCQSRLTGASAGHLLWRVTGCLVASLKCERPDNGCVYVWVCTCFPIFIRSKNKELTIFVGSNVFCGDQMVDPTYLKIHF